MTSGSHTPLLLQPFRALWALVSFVVRFAGRIVAFFLAVVSLALGTLLTSTVIGAVIGIPLIVIGLFLLARSLF